MPGVQARPGKALAQSPGAPKPALGFPQPTCQGLSLACWSARTWHMTTQLIPHPHPFFHPTPPPHPGTTHLPHSSAAPLLHTLQRLTLLQQSSLMFHRPVHRQVH